MLGWRTHLGEMGRADRPGVVRPSQSGPGLRRRQDPRSLLIILCVAPIGRAISLDRVRIVRAAKRANLAATVPPFTSPWAGACTRLMQIQMAVLFFYSALEKIRGDEWWDGDAIWMVFTTNEIYNRLPARPVRASSTGWSTSRPTCTLLIEIAFRS